MWDWYLTYDDNVELSVVTYVWQCEISIWPTMTMLNCQLWNMYDNVRLVFDLRCNVELSVVNYVWQCDIGIWPTLTMSNCQLWTMYDNVILVFDLRWQCWIVSCDLCMTMWDWYLTYVWQCWIVSCDLCMTILNCQQ